MKNKNEKKNPFQQELQCVFWRKKFQKSPLTTPIRYGLPASPKACDIRIWKASAVDRRFGNTTY